MDVDISGAQELALIVTFGGDDHTSDHADWADAIVSCGSPSGATSSYLSDRIWTSMQNGYGPVELDRSNGEDLAGDGRVLTLNGVTYAKGLYEARSVGRSLRPQRHVQHVERGHRRRRRGGIGGSVVFQVWADGVMKYASGVVTGTMAEIPVSVDLRGANALALIVTNGGDNFQ